MFLIIFSVLQLNVLKLKFRLKLQIVYNVPWCVHICSLYIWVAKASGKKIKISIFGTQTACFHITHTFPCTSLYSHTPSDTLQILLSHNKALGEVTRLSFKARAGCLFPPPQQPPWAAPWTTQPADPALSPRPPQSCAPSAVPHLNAMSQFPTRHSPERSAQTDVVFLLASHSPW